MVEVNVPVGVGLEVNVGVGLDAAVVSVDRVVSVTWSVTVGALVLGASGVVVSKPVLDGSGGDNLTPPSDSARSNPPITITHENKAAIMPIRIPMIMRPWF